MAKKGTPEYDKLKTYNPPAPAGYSETKGIMVAWGIMLSAAVFLFGVGSAVYGTFAFPGNLLT